MLIKLPQEVLQIMNVLEEDGHEAYAVGGCIRNCLLGLKVKDYDITTSASPYRVIELFDHVIETGLKHGTVTVMINGEGYEITQYRIDGEYTDNRRPEEVIPTDKIEEDLLRRDLTVNAIAYSPIRGFCDPTGGLKDLNDKVLRFVGDASKRIQEDALRMMRLIRFDSQLKGFSIDESAKAAVKENCDLITNISTERIKDEMDKLLLGHKPENILLLHELGLLKHILPEFIPCINFGQDNIFHHLTVDRHILEAVAFVNSDVDLKWTMLLHDIAKPQCKTIDEMKIGHFIGHQIKSSEIALDVLNRLRFSNNSINRIIKLIELHDRTITTTQKSVRRALFSIGDNIFLDLLEVKRADIKAQNPNFKASRLLDIDNIEEIYRVIKASNECFSMKQLNINGTILISELGLKPGPQIGKILNTLLEKVIDDTNLNNRQILLRLAKEIIDNEASV